jgi:hypothetical protein
VFLPNREAEYFWQKGLPGAANHSEPAWEQVCDFAALQHLLAYWSQGRRDLIRLREKNQDLLSNPAVVC